MSGPRLSIIPARAATDPALKPRDLQVLCVLGRHTDDLGWCRKSQVKMADEMGCARSTVFEAIERLVKAGYLERYVQESDNGRDSPHVYRVILDPKHPDPASVPADETDAADTCRQVGTPADIPAPPAGPEPAPPAGPGPAPKNDPTRTTESERIERDARDVDDRKKIDAEGWALLKDWPGFAGMPKDPALQFWRTLSAEDRATARNRFPSWLELLRRQKKSHIPAPSTYLRERLFEAVPDPAEAPPAPAVAAPFGKLWGVIRMAPLVKGPGPIPPAHGFVAKLIADGGELGERERLAHQARHGWPMLKRMDEAAANRRGWTLHPDDMALERIAETFEQVRVGSDRWSAWQALFEARGWPWLPDPGRQEWVYFPAGGPERLSEFEAAIRGEDDAGGREAAE